ncbi:MAG: LamG-like jellyroll fold domain-containing protein [Planctomycetota bacterium]|nr:LamG-like jellyroll fold domain-containing protein [Planctomycetota bacterium]
MRIQHTIKPSRLLAGLALALTGSNIQAQVGSWRMDRGYGQTVRDSAQGHHGVFGTTDAVEAADPTWSTSGIAGKGLQFGGDDYVTVPDHPKLRLVGDMTICASVYIDAFHRKEWIRIVGKNSGKSETDRNYGLWYHPDQPFLFQIYGVGNRGHANASATLTGKIMPGRWYSLVGVRKGKSVALYVNGTHEGSANLGAAPCTGTGPVTIGKALTLKSAGHKGKIDRVAIYNRALSAKEIRAKYSYSLPAVRKVKLSRAELEARAKEDAAALQFARKDELALKPQVDVAIGKGIKSLLSGQLRDGSWGGANYPVGRTALRVYALVKCGVRVDHPVIQRAYAYLKTARTNRTYSLACAMLAFGVTGDPQHHGQLRKLLTILLRAQGRNGAFGYPGNIDLSNSQYAALGLWVAHKAGIKIDQKVWTKLVDGTLAHQETPRDVDVKITKRTGVGRLQVAGFAYRPIRKPGGAAAVRHTMTTAGVSILKICEIGLGKRLRNKDRRRIQHAVQLGLNFFEAHYTVTKPKPGGQWLLYYLYGLERVGALTRVEQFGDHWWYVDGARHLLKTQNKKSGAWGRAAHDTAFALLFLRRATSYSGPISGGSSSGSTTHLFSAGGPKADIALRGAGQQPVMLYINGFGDALLAEHEEHGLRIMRVEYFEGRRKLGEVPGNPTKAWVKKDTFLRRCTTLTYGDYNVEARVTVIDSGVPAGETTKTVTIKSDPMKVAVRDVVEPWMEGIVNMQINNFLPGLGKKLVIKASSNQKGATAATDGKDASHWVADAKDANPSLTLEFPESTLVRSLTMTQALKNRGSLATRGIIRTVEITLGNSKKPERIEMHQNPLACTQFEFARGRKVRKVTLKIVRRAGKPGLPLGFAEIALSRQRAANSPK